MTNQIPQLPIDYVTKDYEGFYQMMKDYIPILLPEWTNLSNNDPGIAILQALSYGLHVLGYYEDKATSENILELARTRKAILYGARFLGYRPYGATAAKVDVTFTKDENRLNDPIVIPAGARIATDSSLGDQVIFETDEALTIPSGQMTGTVSATEGQSVYDEELGNGDGSPNQTFVLTFPSVLDDSIVLKTEENGVVYIWTRVDSFIDSLPSDRHFTTSVLDDGRTEIMLGNGTSGMRAPYGSIVTADYRYGGGIRGNVGVGKINTIADSRVQGIASVTNLTAAVGGNDSESLERIKMMAPKAWRTAGRAVTRQDFEDFAMTVPGIAKVRCVETFDGSGDINLYIVTPDGSTAPTGLKNMVKDTIEPVMIMGQYLHVNDATYVAFDIVADVYIRDDAVADDVQEAIEEAVQRAFSVDNMNFGDKIYKSYMIKVIMNAHESIINVELDSDVDDVLCDDTEFPKLGTISLTMYGGV